MRLTPYRVAACSALTLSTIAIACIPHPKSDYEDFLERTAHLKPDAEVVDASFDARPPDEAEEGLYAGICVSTLAAKDPRQALRFYTQTQFTPGASEGSLTLTIVPLLGWDIPAQGPISPETIARSEARCCPASPPCNRSETDCAGYSSSEAAVASNGRFTAEFGTIQLPGEANSISGRAAVIEGVKLEGLFGAGERFCAGLGGQLTVPYGFTFDPRQNTCVFQKVNEGDPLPEIPEADYVCPY